MKKRILIGSIIILILSAIPIYAQAPYQKSSNSVSNWRDLTRGDILLQKVILCESGGNFNAYNPKDTDGHPKYGILQFHLPTFITWANTIGIEEPDIWNPEQQIRLYKYAAKTGKLRSWGCFTKMFPN